MASLSDTYRFTMLFETGLDADDYLSIEEGPCGLLYVSTQIEFRSLLCADRHRGQDEDQINKELFSVGVPMELRDRYIVQATQDRPEYNCWVEDDYTAATDLI